MWRLWHIFEASGGRCFKCTIGIMPLLCLKKECIANCGQNALSKMRHVYSWMVGSWKILNCLFKCCYWVLWPPISILLSGSGLPCSPRTDLEHLAQRLTKDQCSAIILPIILKTKPKNPPYNCPTTLASP